MAIVDEYPSVCESQRVIKGKEWLSILINSSDSHGTQLGLIMRVLGHEAHHHEVAL